MRHTRESNMKNLNAKAQKIKKKNKKNKLVKKKSKETKAKKRQAKTCPFAVAWLKSKEINSKITSILSSDNSDKGTFNPSPAGRKSSTSPMIKN